MTPVNFSDALTRLAKHPIGLQGASVLFQIATGVDTNRRISEIAKLRMSLVHSTTNSLKNKGYIQQVHAPNGRMHHVITAKGNKIIKATLKQ